MNIKIVTCEIEEQRFFIIDPQTFFDQKIDDYGAHDYFFNQFTPIWDFFLNQSRFMTAGNLWRLALNFAYDWEEKNKKNNKRIHKGTPYYFWGVTCILNADLENGFLLMHQALEEDKRTHECDKPNTPAYSFVTLDHGNQKQFFKPKVEEVSRFVDEKLGAYRSRTEGVLTLADLKSKFLENSALQDEVFYFVFTIFRLKKLIQEIEQSLKENIFSTLLQANTILDLCLIVENTIRKQNIHKNKSLDGLTIRPLLEFLSSRASLNLNRDNNLGRLCDDFERDFSNPLEQLLLSQYHFQGGTTLQPIEEDIAITYGFRNFGAHKIEDQPIVYKNFDEISRRILNALFFSIEKLYV
jgi:hypothetical protein